MPALNFEYIKLASDCHGQAGNDNLTGGGGAYLCQKFCSRGLMHSVFNGC